MKRLLATVLLGGSISVMSSPATAAGPALTATDAPFVSGGCSSVPYSYEAAPPAGYDDVDVTLSIYTNDGYSSFRDAYLSGASGQGALEVCNTPPGAYRMTMSVFACTPSVSDCQSYNGPTAYFYIGERPITPPPTPASHLEASFAASAKATTSGQLVKFRVKATFGSATSLAAADAVLQQKVSGKWKKIRGSSHSLNAKGRSTWSYRVPGTRLQLRARVSLFDEVVFTKPVTLT